jgi:phosphopantetheinyl transferase (holo-ACP synthase)
MNRRISFFDRKHISKHQVKEYNSSHPGQAWIEIVVSISDNSEYILAFAGKAE